jgi:hypothetical protein
MKPDNTQQEILLVANATCFQKQLCKTDSKGKISSIMDAVEEACWNGLLNEMIPEIIDFPGENLFLWETNQGRSTVQVLLSKIPLPLEKEFSIDPQIFLMSRFEN